MIWFHWVHSAWEFVFQEGHFCQEGNFSALSAERGEYTVLHFNSQEECRRAQEWWHWIKKHEAVELGGIFSTQGQFVCSTVSKQCHFLVHLCNLNFLLHSVITCVSGPLWKSRRDLVKKKKKVSVMGNGMWNEDIAACKVILTTRDYSYKAPCFSTVISSWVKRMLALVTLGNECRESH